MTDQRDDSNFVFCYGSLRPDDDSGMPWTKEAVAGMRGQSASVSGAKLFMDNYASLVFNDNAEDIVVGWVLTADPPGLFRAKMAQFDQIEGYQPDGSGLYQRAITDVCLGDSSLSMGGAPIGTAGSLVRAYVYHRPNCNKDDRVTSGDWLKRGKR